MGRVAALGQRQARRPLARAGRPGPAVPPARVDWEEAFPLARVIGEDGTLLRPEAALPDAEALRLHRHMLRSRELDERMVVLQRQGRIGFYVGAVGEEAAIVGTAAAMREGDWLFPCYREHAAALLRGLPLRTFVAHLLGNEGDVARGRQMPCHEVWAPGRYASVSAPIATQLPHAVGAAWAARIRGDDMVPLVWFGEGATSANDFHTALNFAGVRRVPVVFACRNNGWAISTPRELQTASETVAQKAVAYGIHGERVDGNDLFAVHEATRRARARAASGEGPTLLELVTYRLGAHTTSDDPNAYRPEDLVEPWRRKDPLPRLRRYLRGRGALSDDEHARLRDRIREEIRAAIAEAEALPARPPLESLFEDVYAEPTRLLRGQLEEARGATRSQPGLHEEPRSS